MNIQELIHSGAENQSARIPDNGNGRDLPADISQKHANPDDPEVTDRPERRRYTADYKLAILQEADRCTKKGEIGALLRREGLYSTHLTNWRRERDAGILVGLGARQRGPKAKHDPRDQQINKLQKENDRLKRKLRQAEAIIDVQKKISDLLGIHQPERIDGEMS
jgi:transposase-like protein